MTAQVVVLADVRAARARVTVQVSIEPPPLWLSWYAYWTGEKPKAREPKTGEVRMFSGKSA